MQLQVNLGELCGSVCSRTSSMPKKNTILLEEFCVILSEKHSVTTETNFFHIDENWSMNLRSKRY